MTAVRDFAACALGGFVADENHTLDWLFDVPHAAGHMTRGVASIIKRDGALRSSSSGEATTAVAPLA